MPGITTPQHKYLIDEDSECMDSVALGALLGAVTRSHLPCRSVGVGHSPTFPSQASPPPRTHPVVLRSQRWASPSPQQNPTTNAPRKPATSPQQKPAPNPQWWPVPSPRRNTTPSPSASGLIPTRKAAPQRSTGHSPSPTR